MCMVNYLLIHCVNTQASFLRVRRTAECSKTCSSFWSIFQVSERKIQCLTAKCGLGLNSVPANWNHRRNICLERLFLQRVKIYPAFDDGWTFLVFRESTDDNILTSIKLFIELNWDAFELKFYIWTDLRTNFVHLAKS